MPPVFLPHRGCNVEIMSSSLKFLILKILSEPKARLPPSVAPMRLKDGGLDPVAIHKQCQQWEGKDASCDVVVFVENFVFHGEDGRGREVAGQHRGRVRSFPVRKRLRTGTFIRICAACTSSSSAASPCGSTPTAGPHASHYGRIPLVY